MIQKQAMAGKFSLLDNNDKDCKIVVVPYWVETVG